ncbi:hypothetical protein FLL45_20900 [Aliikangiella marina]|uniref:Uncharacterized protein n=1 Tax=Aliikangiella marina TaxID=1712262 RepID=A0A545T310_9GAMM|nr:hypothetical protein [Aliikangiella marina]TQV71611.1 hypothetical protein FLL45_20900 [Aliikangiella marina]
MSINEMREGYTAIVEHVSDNIQETIQGDWPVDYDLESWESILKQKIEEVAPVGEILDLIVIYMLRTHSIGSAVNTLVATERNEIRLDGNAASQNTIFEEIAKCGNQRIGTTGLLPC